MVTFPEIGLMGERSGGRGGQEKVENLVSNTGSGISGDACWVVRKMGLERQGKGKEGDMKDSTYWALNLELQEVGSKSAPTPPPPSPPNISPHRSLGQHTSAQICPGKPVTSP